MTLDERFSQLREQFGDLTPFQEGELHHACELMHLAAESRTALLQGASDISVADLVKLEDAARVALSDLNLPRISTNATNRLEVVFVDSKPRPKEMLEQEIDLLKDDLRRAQGERDNAREAARKAACALDEAKASKPVQNAVANPEAYSPACTVVESNASVLGRMMYGNGGGDIGQFYRGDGW
jgi:hypothetical protein